MGVSFVFFRFRDVHVELSHQVFFVLNWHLSRCWGYCYRVFFSLFFINECLGLRNFICYSLHWTFWFEESNQEAKLWQWFIVSPPMTTTMMSMMMSCYFFWKSDSVICYKSRITVQFLYSDNKRRRLIQSYLGRIREWITTKSPPPLFEVDPTQPKIVTGIT